MMYATGILLVQCIQIDILLVQCIQIGILLVPCIQTGILLVQCIQCCEKMNRQILGFFILTIRNMD